MRLHQLKSHVYPFIAQKCHGQGVQEVFTKGPGQVLPGQSEGPGNLQAMFSPTPL